MSIFHRYSLCLITNRLDEWCFIPEADIDNTIAALQLTKEWFQRPIETAWVNEQLHREAIQLLIDWQDRTIH